jgi:hypothetical protein
MGVRDRKGMNLFFYSNTNTLRSCLAHGLIACNAYLGEHVHERTLGNLNETTLFVTHLKLSPQDAGKYLEINPHIYPVVLSLQVLSDTVFPLPALLLHVDGQLTPSDLREYDTQQHQGAFVAGELPLFMVDGFLFYTSESMRAFYDPSRNLWFPEALYGLTSKYFQAGIDSVMIQQKGIEADNMVDEVLPRSQLVKLVERREKLRAVALLTAHTAFSPLGENWINLDKLTLSLFNLDQEAELASQAKQVRAQFVPMSNECLEELNAIIGQPMADSGMTGQASFNQAAFDIIYQALLVQNRAQKPDTLALLGQLDEQALAHRLDSGTAEGLSTALQLARQHFQSAIGGNFLQLMQTFPASMPALKGLMIVLKNYDERRLDLFLADLDSFRLRRVDKRYAWVLYAALNGLNPYEGTWKSDLWLNRLCAAYALRHAPHRLLISGTYSHAQYVQLLPKKAKPPKGNTSGYTVRVRPLIEAEDLRAFLIKSLDADGSAEQIYAYLVQNLKPKAKLEAITRTEYHQLKRDYLGQGGPDGVVLKFSKPAIEVKALDTRSFEREWLAAGPTFEGRYKSKADRQTMLSLYKLLTGEEDE